MKADALPSRVGIDALQAAAEPFQLVPCLLQKDTRLQPGEDQRAIGGGRGIGLGPEEEDRLRHPDLDLGKAEVRGQHSDHLSWGAADGDLPADYFRISAEAPLPEAVAQDHDRVAPGLVVLAERPPQDRPGPEQGEEARGGRTALDPLRIPASPEVETDVPRRDTGRHEVERTRFCFDEEDVVRRQPAPLARSGMSLRDHHDPLCASVGQGMKEVGVDQCENGRRCPDTQAQEKNCGYREARPPDQGSEAVAEVIHRRSRPVGSPPRGAGEPAQETRHALRS